MPCIQLTDATVEQHWFLKRAVRDNDTRSKFYQKKQDANPFIQGGYDKKEGWLLIEFWGPKETIQPYVDWLNSVYKQTVREAKRFWGKDFPP
jgi:hypothetical protein